VCSPCFAPGNCRVAPLAARDAPDSTRHCVRGPRRPTPPTRALTHLLGTPDRTQPSRFRLGGARGGTYHFPLHSPYSTRPPVPRPPRHLSRGERFTVAIRAPPSAGLMLRCHPWSLPRAGASRASPYLRAGASWCLEAPSSASSCNATPRPELVEGNIRQRLTGSADAGSAAKASIANLTLSKSKN
jgi:hypothetical protein